MHTVAPRDNRSTNKMNKAIGHSRRKYGEKNMHVGFVLTDLFRVFMNNRVGKCVCQVC